MEPNDTNPRQAHEIPKPSSETVRVDAPAEGENDWNTENAAFVAVYNALIEAEGVALEEYRLF